MVSSGATALQHEALDKAPLPDGYLLKGIVYVFGKAGAPDAGSMVVRKIEEAAREKAEILKVEAGQMELLREIQRGINKLEHGQEKLLAQRPPSPVEPVTDDEARRLFALLRALELESNFRKAPVTRVFMLYCLDGKSRDAVARNCNCSPALITLRLKAIESKLGRKPIELRQFSDQFERIADSLTDTRARRIDRRRAIDGDDPEDEN